jgi:ribosomal protein L18
VHRTGRHIYAQIIDDAAGRTVASASSLVKGEKSIGANLEAAALVGKQIAERPRKPVSPPSSSTVAVTCSMAASRRWLTLPAKAGWSSDHG